MTNQSRRLTVKHATQVTLLLLFFGLGGAFAATGDQGPEGKNQDICMSPSGIHINRLVEEDPGKSGDYRQIPGTKMNMKDGKWFVANFGNEMIKTCF